jgi:2-keto-4-pentenoate hydratase
MTSFDEVIIDARTTGGVVHDVPPLTLSSGYAVAETVWKNLGTPVGWKIGATNSGAQQFLKINTPICGRMFAHGRCQTQDVALIGDRCAEIEPEILLSIGHDGAVEAAYLGLEIVRPSHDHPFEHGVGFIVADNAAHVAFVIGPEFPLAALGDPASIMVTLKLNDVDVGAGDTSMVLGNPLNALNWLRSARDVQPGEWIATGAITPACRFAIGDTVVADFGRFGTVRVTRTLQKL